MSNQKINMNNLEDVLKSLESQTLRVCVVGIGRIGLPTALSFAKSGLDTIGVDINENLVQNINSGNFPLKDEPGYQEIFDNAIKNGVKVLCYDCKLNAKEIKINNKIHYEK